MSKLCHLHNNESKSMGKNEVQVQGDALKNQGMWESLISSKALLLISDTLISMITTEAS